MQPKEGWVASLILYTHYLTEGMMIHFFLLYGKQENKMNREINVKKKKKGAGWGGVCGVWFVVVEGSRESKVKILKGTWRKYIMKDS